MTLSNSIIEIYDKERDNCKMNADNELLINLDKLHTTELGVERIKRCQLVCVWIIGNKCVKFPHDCFISCVEGGGLFSCVIIDNRFLLVSRKFHNPSLPFLLNGDTASLIEKITEKIVGEYRIVDAYRCNISPCFDCRYTI